MLFFMGGQGFIHDSQNLFLVWIRWGRGRVTRVKVLDFVLRVHLLYLMMISTQFQGFGNSINQEDCNLNMLVC